MIGQNGREQIDVRQHDVKRSFRQACKRIVGGSEHCERSIAAQGFHQASCDHRSFKRVVVLAVHNDVHHRVAWRWGWQQHGVDDVHHAVVSHEVRNRHLRIVDEYTVHVDGHSDVGTVQGGHGHAVHEVGAQGRAAHHVVGQDGRQQRGIRQHCVKRFCRNVCEGSVRWSKYSERAITAERPSKASRDDCGLEGRVRFAVHDDVHHSVAWWRGWQQHRVDDVHHAVVSCDVRRGDLSIVDEHAIHVDGHRHIFSVQGRHSHAVHEVGAQRRAAHHVVGQDGRQHVVVSQHRIEGAVRQGGKGVVGGCEHREWSIAAECLSETSSDHCGFEGVVVLAVDDDVDNRVGLGKRHPANEDTPEKGKELFHSSIFRKWLLMEQRRKKNVRNARTFFWVVGCYGVL